MSHFSVIAVVPGYVGVEHFAVGALHLASYQRYSVGTRALRHVCPEYVVVLVALVVSVVIRLVAAHVHLVLDFVSFRVYLLAYVHRLAPASPAGVRQSARHVYVPVSQSSVSVRREVECLHVGV